MIINYIKLFYHGYILAVQPSFYYCQIIYKLEISKFYNLCYTAKDRELRVIVVSILLTNTMNINQFITSPDKNKFQPTLLKISRKMHLS